MIATQWIWLAVALPLAGFLVNGALALRRRPATLSAMPAAVATAALRPTIQKCVAPESDTSRPAVTWMSAGGRIAVAPAAGPGLG